MAKYYVSKKDRSVFEKFIDEAAVNLSQHAYDSFIEDNVEHYRKAGIESLIIRRQLADCCDWCAALAGTYEYKRGKYPSDIFRRHENCRCMVTCSQGKGGYQDVWTKIEYKTQREARAAREEEIEKQQKNFEKFERKKRIARDNGEKFVDATEYWENKPKVYPARIDDTPKKFTYKGEKYEQDGVHIFIDKDEDAEKARLILKETYGGEIERFPQIQQKDENHPAKKTPDFLWNGIAYDEKTIYPDNKSDDCIYNAVNKKKEQAKRFVFDVSKSSIPIEKICRSAESAFYKKDWVEQIIFIKDGKVYKVFEQI